MYQNPFSHCSCWIHTRLSSTLIDAGCPFVCVCVCVCVFSNTEPHLLTPHLKAASLSQVAACVWLWLRLHEFKRSAGSSRTGHNVYEWRMMYAMLPEALLTHPCWGTAFDPTRASQRVFHHCSRTYTSMSCMDSNWLMKNSARGMLRATDRRPKGNNRGRSVAVRTVSV